MSEQHSIPKYYSYLNSMVMAGSWMPKNYCRQRTCATYLHRSKYMLSFNCWVKHGSLHTDTSSGGKEEPVFFSWQTVPVNPTIGKFSTTNLNAFSACLYFFLSFFFFDEWVKWRKAFTVCCCVGVQICTRVDKYTWWFWEKSVHVFCH